MASGDPQGARLLISFPAAYSPNLNPIEMTLSMQKAYLRCIGTRTYEPLVRALGDGGLFDFEACWDFFKTAGYASQ